MRPARDYLTRAEIEDRLAAMPPGDLQRLNALGQRMAGRSSQRAKPHELTPPLLDVLEALITGDRRIPRTSDFCACVYVAMRSHVSNERLTAKARRAKVRFLAKGDRRRRNAKGIHVQPPPDYYEGEPVQ